MADAALEKLSGKYRSVLNRMEQLQVRLLNLHVQDGKLVLKGHARTQADSNDIWNQIKLVDAQYADLLAEITYDTATPAAAPAAPAPAPVRTYTVQKGDTLSKIAAAVYGKASAYPKIFEANRDQLDDPDKIKPGQVLKLPE
jgi:LysM repeat protein